MASSFNLRTARSSVTAKQGAPSPTPATHYGIGSRNNHVTIAQVSDEQMREIKEAFEVFDADQDGKLNHHELRVAMRALGFDVLRQDITKLIRDHHGHAEGVMYYEDFQKILIDRISKRDPLDEIKRAFRLFDEDGTGGITISSLGRVAKELNESIDEQELMAMIEEFDLDGDGKISLEEFIALMRDDN